MRKLFYNINDYLSKPSLSMYNAIYIYLMIELLDAMIKAMK